MEASNEKVYHILIVEDSPTQAKQLEFLLHKQGFMVAIAANGRKGIEEAKRSKPGLIISDIQMPEMNGFEMCRLIKQDPGLKEIPIILLTTLTDPSDVIEALNINADSYISKPYDENHMIAKINQLLAAPVGDKIDRPGEVLEIDFAGKQFAVTSNRSQIITLLISIYEDMLMKNHKIVAMKEALEDVNGELGNKLRELQATKEDLRKSYEELEMKVKMRTADLKQANTELLEQIRVREKAEAALQVTNEEIRTISQQLLQAEKLATMGELAASIAHELNNPLATVSLRVESLIAQSTGDDARRRELDIIGQEVERMSNLITNLLQFSRRSRPQVSTVNVCDEIEKTLELVHYHLRKHKIAVAREFMPEGPLIHADRQQMRQLFLNLFTNASDAMPDGGTLTIRVTSLPDDKKICIEMADTGMGIPPGILPKVLEPFYTTKPEGKGTGLGLSICRRIAEAHNGTLNITSEGTPGKGARICITLPFSTGSNTAFLKDE